MEPEKKEGYDIFKEDYTSLEVSEETQNASPPPQNLRDPRIAIKQARRKKIIRTILILTALILLLLGLIVGSRITRKQETNITINTQSLDNGTLNQLTPANGGETKQQLTITPDTLFKGNLDVQGSTNISNNVQVGGTLLVKGDTTLQGRVAIDQDLNIQRRLSVNQDASVGGNLSVSGLITAASLSVGSLTISTVNVSGDVTFSGHLVPNGSSPSARASLASSGGSVTVSGNDTAGTITITIGSGAVQTGEMAIITFDKAFALTPKVQLTPINAQSAALNFYASRNAQFFTVLTATMPTNGASYVYDYLVTQ